MSEKVHNFKTGKRALNFPFARTGHRRSWYELRYSLNLYQDSTCENGKKQDFCTPRDLEAHSENEARLYQDLDRNI